MTDAKQLISEAISQLGGKRSDPISPDEICGKDLPIITMDPENFTLIWLDSSTLNTYLKSHCDDPVNTYTGEFKENWFYRMDEIIAFIAPQMSISTQGEIVFTNGRHRTRWLIQNNLGHLPISVPHDQVDAFSAVGLCDEGSPCGEGKNKLTINCVNGEIVQEKE